MIGATMNGAEAVLSFITCIFSELLHLEVFDLGFSYGTLFTFLPCITLAFIAISSFIHLRTTGEASATTSLVRTVRSRSNSDKGK